MSHRQRPRPRRLRRTSAIRRLARECDILPRQLIYPIFLTEGHNVKSEIKTMPGCFRMSIDAATEEVKSAIRLGINGFALFPHLPDELKDSMASAGRTKDGLIPRAIKTLKDTCPEACLITDVAMDPYSSDGHDGLVKDGKILNDETLPILAEMALAQAEAGADFVAPSDMMDGRVRYIRDALDENGFVETGIIAYSAKYASAFYGPFRDALESAPRFGDKKTYQMATANQREAVRETLLDVEEGADVVMVKPALSYLDVIAAVKKVSAVPVAAYNVSGEYALIKAGAAQGLFDHDTAMLEVLTSIRRAGADLIFTYHAVEAAKLLRD